MSSVETAAILFSDLVGSTQLASRVGPAVADDLRREHFEVLRAAVADNEGHEVKNTGDGLMVAFKSASASVRCAITMQQLIGRRNAGSDEDLHIRVGIAFGEVTVEDGDYFGMPSNEAARLCDKAATDGILTSALVRMMAAREDRDAFTSIGELELKGLPEPVEAFEVSWEPLGAELSAVPLPASLQSQAAMAFVGREEERARLAELTAEAAAGSRRVGLLTGEPGIGKTRLATQAARELHGEGATVLWGAAAEDLRAPYGPWMQALSHYVAHAPDEILDEHVLRHGGEIGRLARGLDQRVAQVPAPQQSDPATERYLLFAAVTELLCAACEERPAVLVLDDLHWADAETLSLLHHVVREVQSVPLLILVTYRDTDLRRGHPLTKLLADLRRVEGVENFGLSGLTGESVAALMTIAAGHEMDERGLSLAHEITQETGGNPFFVAEMLRHLIESGAMSRRDDGRWVLNRPIAELELPQGVREVIGRRVESLGEETAKILSVASVIGRDFDVDVLSQVVERGEDDVLDALEAAVEVSVLAESSERVGSFRFANALFNHTLYDDIGATRRTRLHRRVAEALEQVCGDDPGDRVSDLAVHWSRANGQGDSGKAAGYMLRAGEAALAELAPDEALRWLTQADGLMRNAGGEDTVGRCDVLIGLGEAQRQLGVADFRETLLEAAGVARRLGDDDRLARAALANTRGFTSEIGNVDEERVEVLETAAQRLPADDPRRADVVALLAMELSFDPDADRRVALAREALELARAAADDDTLLRVIDRYLFATWLPETLEERLELSVELVERAERSGDPFRRLLAFNRRIYYVLEAGQADEADSCLETMRQIADAVPQPFFRWVVLYQSAMMSQLHGRLEEADAFAEEAVGVGTDSGEPDAVLLYAGQLTFLRREQGRVAEIADLIDESVESYPGIPAWAAMQASTRCELGDRDAARAALAAADFDAVPHDFLRLTAYALWADVCVAVRAADRAQDLYERLAPFRDQVIDNGVIVVGVVAHYLGELAALSGDFERAERDFERAAEICRRAEAPGLLARTEEALSRAGVSA